MRGWSMIGQESLSSSEHQRNFPPSNRPSAKCCYRVVSSFPLTTSKTQKLHSVHFWSNRPKLSKVLPLCWLPFWWKEGREPKDAQLKQAIACQFEVLFSNLGSIDFWEIKDVCYGFKAGKIPHFSSSIDWKSISASVQNLPGQTQQIKTQLSGIKFIEFQIAQRGKWFDPLLNELARVKQFNSTTQPLTMPKTTCASLSQFRYSVQAISAKTWRLIIGSFERMWKFQNFLQVRLTNRFDSTRFQLVSSSIF